MAEVRDYAQQFFVGNPVSGATVLEEGQYSTPTGQFIERNEADLLALNFFWMDKVLPKDRQKYFNLLGELYELFMTPHVVPIPPYRDCSYQKKFELLLSHQNDLIQMLEHITNILSFDSTNTLVLKKYFNINTSDSIVLPEEIEENIKSWFRNRKYSTIVFPLTLEGGRHVVFFALRKSSAFKLQMVYVDGQGFNDNPRLYEFEKEQREIRKLIQEFLRTQFFVTVEDIHPSCPILQQYEQGGNCQQWFLFNFALFVFNPAFMSMDMGSSVLRVLSRKPDLNVQLFALAMFLRTMPRVGLINYIDGVEAYDVMIEDCINESNDTRQHTLQNTIGAQDCYSQPSGVCPSDSCVQCSGTCHFKSSVRQFQNGECLPLSAKQIARKMLYIYARIRKITGQDPRSMTTADIEQQLNFVEPTTAEEFIRLNRLDPVSLQRRRIAFSSRQRAILEQQQQNR
jgi:hypothetical protein